MGDDRAASDPQRQVGESKGQLPVLAEQLLVCCIDQLSGARGGDNKPVDFKRHRPLNLWVELVEPLRQLRRQAFGDLGREIGGRQKADRYLGSPMNRGIISLDTSSRVLLNIEG